ncbi:MAG: hypothetical protein HY681_15105 [Chloroflexi bacterium]|nr:hypothetical protein [Chloroflexota bacterium]
MLRRRPPTPPHLTVELRPGPRPPAWDTLWRRLLSEIVLAPDSTNTQPAPTSRSGQEKEQS